MCKESPCIHEAINNDILKMLRERYPGVEDIDITESLLGLAIDLNSDNAEKCLQTVLTFNDFFTTYVIEKKVMHCEPS